MSEVTAEMVAEMMRQEVEKMQIDKEADATRMRWKMSDQKMLDSFEKWWKESGWEPHDAKPVAREAWLAAVAADRKHGYDHVGEIVDAPSLGLTCVSIPVMPPVGTKLYIKPQFQEAPELTDLEINVIWHKSALSTLPMSYQLRAIRDIIKADRNRRQ